MSTSVTACPQFTPCAPLLKDIPRAGPLLQLGPSPTRPTFCQAEPEPLPCSRVLDSALLLPGQRSREHGDTTTSQATLTSAAVRQEKERGDKKPEGDSRGERAVQADGNGADGQGEKFSHRCQPVSIPDSQLQSTPVQAPPTTCLQRSQHPLQAVPGRFPLCPRVIPGGQRAPVPVLPPANSWLHLESSPGVHRQIQAQL